MRYSLLAWMFMIGASLGLTNLSAQSVTVFWTADTNAISIGEPIEATLTLRQAANLRVSWPLVADSLFPLDVLSAAAPDSTVSAEAVQIQQRFTLTAFDSGRYELPALGFQYLVVGESHTRTARAEALAITVLTVPIDTAAAPRDIAPIQEEPITVSEIGAWGGTLLLLLAIGFGSWYYLKKRPKPVVEEIRPVIPQVPPYEIAMRGLAKVEAEKYWQKGQIKPYYSALTDVVRTYIEQAFSVAAMESVTDEIVGDLEKKALPDKVLWPLKSLLRNADLAKFAKFNPDDQANLQAMETARSFIKETKNWSQRMESAPAADTPTPESQDA